MCQGFAEESLRCGAEVLWGGADVTVVSADVTSSLDGEMIMMIDSVHNSSLVMMMMMMVVQVVQCSCW